MPSSDRARATQRAASDVELSADERGSLLEWVARICDNEPTSHRMLRQLGFPVAQIPAWTGAPMDWWDDVFRQFDLGVVDQPYRKLISALYQRYQANPLLKELHERDLAGDSGPPPTEAARVIIQASTDSERVNAARELQRIGLDPQEVWSTEHAMSFTVNTGDVANTRQRLEATTLGWTVMGPGQPEYLLRELFVQGPDGRRHRVIDAPAHQTVGNVADEVIGRYSDHPPSRPGVVEHVVAVDKLRRLDPDDTLHEAGIGDGDVLRIGFEARAGGGQEAALFARPRRRTEPAGGWATELLQQLLVTALAIRNPQARFEALLGIAASNSGYGKQIALTEALSAVRQIRNPRTRAKALVRLAAELPGVSDLVPLPWSNEIGRPATWWHRLLDSLELLPPPKPDELSKRRDFEQAWTELEHEIDTVLRRLGPPPADLTTTVPGNGQS